MHTYKIFHSILKEDLENVLNALIETPTRAYTQTLLEGDGEEFKQVKLKRVMKNLVIDDKILWGDFQCEITTSYIDFETEKRTVGKLRQETKFCYFKVDDQYYCIQYPNGTNEGRKALKWFIKQAYNKKGVVLRNIRFDEGFIEQFMKINPNIAKRLRVPQETGTSSYVEVGGPDVSKDEIYRAARLRGSEPKGGILLLPSIGWQIRITPSGVIQCYQDPMSDQFINFIIKRIMPLV